MNVDFSEYEDIVTIIQDPVKLEIENGVVRAASKIGIYIDKDELIKALRYDRDQYSKGYECGYKKAIVDFMEKAQQLYDDNAELLCALELIAKQLKDTDLDD